MTATAFVVVLVAVAGVVVTRWSDRGTTWDLVEDFARPALRPQHWGVYEWARDNGSLWSPSAVRVSGGELQVAGIGREPTGRGNVAGGVCWCKEAAPRGSYGVWEVKAKVDTGAGYGAIVGLWPRSEHDAEGYLTLARIDLPDRRRAYSEAKDRNGKRVTGNAVLGDFTAWNTFTIQWRPDVVVVRLNGETIFDSRQSGFAFAVPNTPMYLYVQVIPGPDGPIPAPDAQTPDQVVLHVDEVRYSA